MSINFLVNPLDNPVALPLMGLMAATFGMAGALLWMATRRKLQAVSLGGTTVGTSPVVLWQRYRTWALIAPLYLVASLSGPLAVALLAGFISWQGGQEYARLSGLDQKHMSLMVWASWLTVAATLLFGGQALLYAPVVAFFGWSALSLAPVDGEKNIEKRYGNSLNGLWGYLYLGWLPAHLVGLSQSAVPALVLAVGAGVALSDVGAFCAGKAIRGPKLAPRLSPNKTWGGIAGNLVGAEVALALVAFTLPALPWWVFLSLTAAIGLGSVCGDLLESLLKRQSGVKDAGNLLPGFGGLLDRIDSLLLVAPLVYYLTVIFF